jgi:hypothetical protein
MADREKVRFATNVPKVLVFRYSAPREYPAPEANPDWGPSYLYGVTEDGSDRGLFASQYLHDLLQRGNVQIGSKVKIVKSEDPSDARKKSWQVEVDGVDATSEVQQAAPPVHDAPPEPPPPEEVYSQDIPPSPGEDIPRNPLADVGAIYLACLRIAQAALGADHPDVQAATATMFIAADRRKIAVTPRMQEAFRGMMRDSLR